MEKGQPSISTLTPTGYIDKDVGSVLDADEMRLAEMGTLHCNDKNAIAKGCTFKATSKSFSAISPSSVLLVWRVRRPYLGLALV